MTEDTKHSIFNEKNTDILILILQTYKKKLEHEAILLK